MSYNDDLVAKLDEIHSKMDEILEQLMRIANALEAMNPCP